jgi:hypothetical protein
MSKAATLTVFGSPPTKATLALRSVGTGRRLARALGGLVLCWTATLVAVFIPVAHFVLVPGLAIAGVVWAVSRLRERERVLWIHGTCPRCGREEDFVPAGRSGRQLTVDCPSCFNRLDVHLEEERPGGTPAGPAG